MNFEYGTWNKYDDHREIGFSISKECGYIWLVVDLWRWWFSVTLKKGYGHDQSRYN